VRILLVATYELGQQPGALGAAAALLQERGDDVRVLDVSVEPWDPALAAWADEIAFSVPMHTATRLARDLARDLDRPVRAFGLYAAQCHDFATPIEWDAAAMDVLPARDLLPALDHYARLDIDGEQRLAGAVLATHGCAHRCRHCPVPVVFDGRVRRVDEDIVLADVAQLVAAGARHITFGDPDFLNAPPHARRIVAALHDAHPDVTFDCTVKVEHVLRHEGLWPELAAAGCVFVVSAFESVDDAMLDRLDKGHTTADAARAIAILRDAGIEVRPSWLPFTPWTTRDDVVALLDFVHAHDLVGSVDPVQYSVRLLLPEGSLLLDHPDLAPFVGPWDPERSTFSWSSADRAIDELQQRIAAIVDTDDDPVAVYARVRDAAGAAPVDLTHATTGRPRLTESWFCCAEPTELQRSSVTVTVPFPVRSGVTSAE
jgi:pyruvate-formate lyase-activating enzyme